MGVIQIATPFNIDLEFEIAEFHKRLFAYLIDFTLLILYFTSMKYFYYGGFNTASEDVLKSHVGIDILTISLPMLLYSLVTEVMMHGQTIGKKIMNIRVISLNGGEPQLSQYIVRWMFKAFEWPFFFGYTILTSGEPGSLYFYYRFFGNYCCNHHCCYKKKSTAWRPRCQYGCCKYQICFFSRRYRVYGNTANRLCCKIS